MAAPRPVVPAIRRIEPMASLEDMRRHIADLQEAMQTREPLESGNALDKYLTLRQAVDSGIVIYSLGGGGGPVIRPPPPTGGTPGDWDDLTPPDPLTGLVVTSIPTGFFIEFDAPTYSQGGGNAYSIIYRANYSGAGPLPTFSSAVECGRTTERSPILIIAAEPGTQSHFWAQPVSHAEDYNGMTPQTSPTGGTNGEYTTAGQLSDDHIASLAVGKLLAGSIAVGEYIQSTGFVSGSYGFKLEGDGDSEFNNVIVRGTIYATAGLIGGAVIDADGVESDNYVANTSGWRLDNNTGTIYANDIMLPEGIVTSSANDYSSYGTVDWPTATSSWSPYPTTGAGMVGVLHTRHTGTLVIRSDVSLNCKFSSATTVAAARVQVELGRKPSAASATYVPIRSWEFVVPVAAKDAANNVASLTAAFNYQFESGELTTGDDYYFALFLTTVEALDASGSPVSVGTSANDLVEKDAFIGTIENKV
jgi:hypothetical protein